MDDHLLRREKNTILGVFLCGAKAGYGCLISNEVKGGMERYGHRHGRYAVEAGFHLMLVHGLTKPQETTEGIHTNSGEVESRLAHEQRIMIPVFPYGQSAAASPIKF